MNFDKLSRQTLPNPSCAIWHVPHDADGQEQRLSTTHNYRVNADASLIVVFMLHGRWCMHSFSKRRTSGVPVILAVTQRARAERIGNPSRACLPHRG